MKKKKKLPAKKYTQPCGDEGVRSFLRLFRHPDSLQRLRGDAERRRRDGSNRIEKIPRAGGRAGAAAAHHRDDSGVREVAARSCGVLP